MTALALNFYDHATGRITDPAMFMLADADLKRRVIALWANDNARHAATFADKIDAFFSDAQVGYAFLTPQLHRIEAEVYMTRYPSFDITEFMPVDTSGDMWDVGTLVYSMDNIGQAKFLAAGAFDVPYADTKMSQNVRNYHLAGIGYEWNTQEMQRAAKLGRSLPSDKALAAGQAADVFVYKVAMTGQNPAGVSEKGWTGFTNNGSVPSAQVPADGTGSLRTFASKTPDQVLRDVNELITSVEVNTGEVHVANAVTFPTSIYDYLATTRITGTSMTIMAFLLANNVAGPGLKIKKSRALETAGTGGTKRMIAYDFNPLVLKFHLPGAHQFLPPFQKGSLLYEVAGIMNVGGTEVRLPKAMSYRDGM
jgi:hypothetical protein